MSQVRTVKCQKLYKEVGEFGLKIRTGVISLDRTQLRTGSSKSLEGTWKKSNHFVLVELLMRQSRSVSLKDCKVYSYSLEGQHVTPAKQWRGETNINSGQKKTQGNSATRKLHQSNVEKHWMNDQSSQSPYSHSHRYNINKFIQILPASMTGRQTGQSRKTQ